MNKEINSLYIHIPFCHQICDYCDFTKLQYFRHFALSYLKSLKEELAFYHPHNLKTIYVGGGTPTALDDDLFLSLLEIINPYLEGVEEYTFEANPESLTLNKIKLLYAHHVNRVSLGVQTTDDKILKSLNRQHTFLDVKEAIKNLKEVGINNINVDLILGLPNSNIATLKQDLDNVLSLDIKHLSCYGLTVSPHTVMYQKGVSEPQPDILRKYYDIVEETLKKHGFIHYEISNWCLPGYQSLHNLTYWRNFQYYGVGLGASGYIDDIRYKNTVNLSRYLKGEYLAEKEKLSPKDLLTYQIMLNLRTNEGLDLNFLRENLSSQIYQQKEEIITSFIKDKLAVIKDNHLIATYEGMMILDQLILQLL